MERQIPFQFNVLIDSQDLTPTADPELQTGKVRVFYKGLNRNGSFITDEFAEKFAVSAYSKPVFGSYNIETSDFEGHEGSQKAKAYGYVIPGSLSWTEHQDEDGVTRTYATYDVILWAAYWPECAKAFGKGQSMEIDPSTIKGDWKIVTDDGIEAYKYTDGVMAGLCILGDKKEPCFEGSAFFSTENSEYQQFLKAIANYGGKKAMEEEIKTFEETPAAEENPVVEEEEKKEETLAAEETPVAEEEIPAAEEETSVVEEEQPAEEEAPAEPEFDYVSEYAALQGRYNELNTTFEARNSEFAQLQADFEKLQNDYAELQTNYTALQEQFEANETSLGAVKAQVLIYEKAEKERIIDKFSGRLPADSLQPIIDELDNLTVEDVNTRCAVAYTAFSMAKEKGEEIRVPQVPKQERSALATILERYKK